MPGRPFHARFTEDQTLNGRDIPIIRARLDAARDLVPTTPLSAELLAGLYADVDYLLFELRQVREQNAALRRFRDRHFEESLRGSA